MRLYRDVWVTATAVLVTLGFWAALSIGTVPAVLGLFVSFAILGVLVGLIQAKDDRPGARGRAVGGGIVASASLVAIGGLVGVVGPEVVWLVVVAVIVSPWTLRRCARRVRRFTAGPPASWEQRLEPAEEGAPETFSTLPVITDPDKVGLLDDGALCLAWRRSFVALQRSCTLPSRLFIVEQRQLYLDELERRNPTGLYAWLESGARAAGDPSRFILLS